MANTMRAIIDGLWSIASKELPVGNVSFPIWVPTAFAIMIGLTIKFLGGGKTE